MELNICHLYPDILNLYGDRGNILCMQKRLEWRGIGVTVTGVSTLCALKQRQSGSVGCRSPPYQSFLKPTKND